MKTLERRFLVGNGLHGYNFVVFRAVSGGEENDKNHAVLFTKYEAEKLVKENGADLSIYEIKKVTK